MSRVIGPEHIHGAFQSAFNQQDLETIVGLYEPEAALVHGGALVRGQHAIREAYRSVLGLHPTIDVQTLQVISVRDTALLRGTWSWQATALDGTPLRRSGRSIEIVRLQADGGWRFVIDDPGVSRS